MLLILTFLASFILNKYYIVTCDISQTNNLRSLCTELEDQVLYCFEYHKLIEYSVECAGMCFNHKSPAWDDEFLNSQGACSLFAYNESSTAGTNCMLCLLLNGGEVYQVNTSHVIADYVFLNSKTTTGKFTVYNIVGISDQKRTKGSFTLNLAPSQGIQC